jgi:hypothetical protein
METMFGAYAFAFALVSAYVGWLAARNRGVCRRLEQLERRASPKHGPRHSSSRAA